MEGKVETQRNNSIYIYRQSMHITLHWHSLPQHDYLSIARVLFYDLKTATLLISFNIALHGLFANFNSILFR